MIFPISPRNKLLFCVKFMCFLNFNGEGGGLFIWFFFFEGGGGERRYWWPGSGLGMSMVNHPWECHFIKKSLPLSSLFLSAEMLLFAMFSCKKKKPKPSSHLYINIKRKHALHWTLNLAQKFHISSFQILLVTACDYCIAFVIYRMI